MKISTIEIKLEPNEKEKEANFGVVYIRRDEEKRWTANNGGLLPYQIRIINAFQELIKTFNTQEGE